MESSTKTLSIALMFAIALTGCGTNNSKPSGPTSSTPSASQVASMEAGMLAVPNSAIAVATIASPLNFWELLVKQRFFPIPIEDAEALNTAMMAHVDRHLGIDLSGVQSIVVYAVEDGGASIVWPVRGTLKGTTETDGVTTLVLDPGKGTMLVAKHKDKLLIGETKAVRVSLALLKGQGEALSGDFANFAKVQRKGSYLSLSAQLDKLPLPPMPFTEGLTRVALKVGESGIRLQIEGDTETLELLKDQFSTFVQMGLDEIKTEMDRTQDDFLAGAANILGYYNGRGVAKTLTPIIQGRTMTIEFNLFDGGGTGMVIVAGVGVLAAVAGPAFMQYTAKTKTTEAVMFLKEMSHSAGAHYRRSKSGAPLSIGKGTTKNSFPASVGPTPPLGTCCADGGKCRPAPDAWNHPTWRALDFSISDPHYFSYEFKSSNDDGVVSYTALAYGDLDCDGVYSTYSLYGQVIGEWVQEAGDVIKVNPLE